jgi:hypothetical protein
MNKIELVFAHGIGQFEGAHGCFANRLSPTGSEGGCWHLSFTLTKAVPHTGTADMFAVKSGHE